MSADAEKLREEIYGLDKWIEARAEELRNELHTLHERARTLIRVSASESEIETTHRRIEDLKKEMDSLNEMRQVCALKKALLRKLGDRKPEQ